MSVTGVLEITSRSGTMRGVGLSTDREPHNRIQAKPHEDLTYKIIGAAMRVHNRLGPGLKEAHYQRALSLELQAGGLNFVPEQAVQICIDGAQIGLLYLDHLVEDAVVVEEKAVSHLLTNEEIAQVITYPCATGKSVGLLINFGRAQLEYKRILAPRTPQDWRSRIRRYVWVPPDARSAYPLSPSVDSPEVGR